MKAKYTMEFTPAAIIEVLKPIIEKETGRAVESIEFMVDPGYDDRMDSRPPSLKSVKVNLGGPLSKPTFNEVPKWEQFQK